MSLTTSLADLAIILVEPSQMQAHLVTRMLEHQGVRKVSTVDKASAAMALLKAESTNVIVISSLYLPDQAGTELVAAMRANPDFETVPFILVSSETRPQVLVGSTASNWALFQA